MRTFDPKTIAYIHGSLAKHFKTVADGLGIPFYSEGLDDPTSEVYQNTNLSLRVDGPMVMEGSSLTDYRVEVQAFLTFIGKSGHYDNLDYAGTVAEALRSTIPVYDLPNATPTQVGCLDLDRSSVESVRLVNFSRVSTSSNVRQIALVSRLLYESGQV